MNKLNLDYLRKNLDLIKLLNLFNKNKTKFANEKIILDYLLESCSSNDVSKNDLEEAIWNDDKFLDKIETSFIDGKFLPMISDNFQFIKNFYIAEPKTKENKYVYDEKHHAFDHQIIYSKIDKKYYIMVYQYWDYTNDGYYCRESFSKKSDAIKLIEKEQKILKKDFLHFLRKKNH